MRQTVTAMDDQAAEAIRENHRLYVEVSRAAGDLLDALCRRAERDPDFGLTQEEVEAFDALAALVGRGSWT